LRRLHNKLTNSLTLSQARQPMEDLARLKKTAPTISVLDLILQFLTPNLSASLITPSIHLRFGLPACLLPSGLSKVIFLHGRLSCIRTICPALLNLVILIVVTRSVSSYRQYSSSFFLKFFSQKLQDVTRLPYSEPRFPPHTSGLVLLMSYIWSLYAFYLCF
jgi:hypothetical protein